MKIATWNVNSVKARLPHLVRWLGEAAPDAVLLQELKCPAPEFPHFEVEAAGYQALVVGQKSYNGVAILTRGPAQLVLDHLPGDAGDEQARYLEADYGNIRLCALYLPNGNPIGTEKFTYKLGWMARLRARAIALLAEDRPFVMAGDYNVCPTEADVWNPAGFAQDALCQPESRAAWRALVNLGLTDVLRALHPRPHLYTYWDYQGAAWAADHGLRIDHLLLSPELADRLEDAGVDRSPRGWERASDHTPVWCRIGPAPGRYRQSSTVTS